MTSWWVLRVLESGGPPFLIAHVIWVIASITLHELAHGWAAIKRGDMSGFSSFLAPFGACQGLRQRSSGGMLLPGLREWPGKDVHGCAVL